MRYHRLSLLCDISGTILINSFLALGLLLQTPFQSLVNPTILALSRLFSNPATNNTTRLCVCELLEQLGPVLDQQHVLNCDEVLHEFLRPLDGEDCTAAVLSMRAIVSLAALAESRLDVYYRILRCFNSKRHSVCSVSSVSILILPISLFAHHDPWATGSREDCSDCGAGCVRGSVQQQLRICAFVDHVCDRAVERFEFDN